MGFDQAALGSSSEGRTGLGLREVREENPDQEGDKAIPEVELRIAYQDNHMEGIREEVLAGLGLDHSADL